MRRTSILGLVALLALVVLNHGPMMDALAYRRVTAQAAALLPPDWRESAGMEAQVRLEHLTRSLQPEQVLAAREQGALLRIEGGQVVLALPIGLDSDTLDLATGCFRFARRRVNLIVWHYYSSIGCL